MSAAPQVGDRLTYVQPVLEVTEIKEDGSVKVRDQFGWDFAIHPDDFKRYEHVPAEEEVKEAAHDGWQERDLRRESLSLAIANRNSHAESFKDTVARAEAFYAYLKGEQA
jgi:hypothetical protein